jgi:hypothetical protein
MAFSLRPSLLPSGRTLTRVISAAFVATLLNPYVSGQQPAGCGAATPQLSPAETAARTFQQSARRGQEHARGVDRVLKDLKWHKNLADAAKVAQREGKPIVWVQALGDIRGVT